MPKEIVLVGGGHAHVEALHALAFHPPGDARLTLVSDQPWAFYSGMAPGYVAGHYTIEDCRIDLANVARPANARLVAGTVTGIDRRERLVMVEGQEPLPYDLLSIDVGGASNAGAIEGAREHAISVRPISTFSTRWEAFQSRLLDGAGSIAVIGGGAAGFELILAIRHRLRSAGRPTAPPGDPMFTLIAGGELLDGHNPRAQDMARAALAGRSVALIENDMAAAIDDAGVMLASGGRVPATAVVLATPGAPPAWFPSTGLPLDPDGFLATRATLQLIDDEDVFAAGDCATVLDHPRPKAGVFAVRQGPWLADNLRRRALGRPARPFVPQRESLSLLSLGEKSAIASRGPFAVSGRWVWRWKDRIDRSFVRKHNASA